MALILESLNETWLPCPIPYHQRELDYYALNQFLTKHVSNGIPGFIFSDQQPGYARLSEAQRENVIRFSATTLKGRKRTLVELKTKTLEEAIPLAWRFFNAGADALALNPSDYIASSGKISDSPQTVQGTTGRNSRQSFTDHAASQKITDKILEYVHEITRWISLPYYVALNKNEKRGEENCKILGKILEEKDPLFSGFLHSPSSMDTPAHSGTCMERIGYAP